MGFEVLSAYDEEASREHLIHLLRVVLPGIARREDRVVIFYAGHGACGTLPSGEQAGFIIPSDGKSVVDGWKIEITAGQLMIHDYDTFAERANFVSVEEIRNVSNAIAAKHILFILDGCYSGFLDPAVFGPRRSKTSAQRVAVASLRRGKSRGVIVVTRDEPEGAATGETSVDATDYLDVITSRDTIQVLTAGSSGEKVYEKSGHGLFTHYLLRAIDGLADLNKDCIITASELGTYLKQTVSVASNSAQTPLFNRVSGEGEFIFIPPICEPVDAADLVPPVPDEEWSRTDAYRGPKQSPYEKPEQVVLDNEESVYVLDTGLRRILKFDPSGRYTPMHTADTGLSAGWYPTFITSGCGEKLWAYYSNGESGMVVIHEKDGALAAGWTGKKEPLRGYTADDGTVCSFPGHGLVALDIEENLIIVDQESGIVTKCDRNGKLLSRWGGAKKGQGIIEDGDRFKTVHEPRGVATDIFGYVYVADTGGHGIQKYYDGEWIPAWPNVRGAKPHFFNGPHGLAVDSKLHVYVADTGNHRIKKYTSGGEKLLTYWGREKARKGKKHGQFNRPMGVAVNWDGTAVFVADTGNRRLQRFVVRR